MNSIGDNSVKGTGIKINVNMEPIDGRHMEDVDFFAEVFSDGVLGRTETIRKEKATRVDADNYIVRVDTKVVGSGRYFVRLTAFIPDTDFDGGLRTEIRTCDTKIDIDAR